MSVFKLLQQCSVSLLLAAFIFACGFNCDDVVKKTSTSRQQFGSNLQPDNESLTCHQCRASYLPGVSLFKCLAIAGRTTCSVPRHSGKCATQIQVQYSPQVGAKVHTVLRICFNTAETSHTSNKSWLDYSDGCRMAINPVNYSAEYCFCSEDMCNGASGGCVAVSAAGTMAAAALAVFVTRVKGP